MYAEKLKQFENVENLGGKAWEHAIACDFFDNSPVKDCSMHCFHYQQLFELLFKHLLETRSEFGAYPRTHKLGSLLAQLVKETDFKTDVDKYESHLTAITVCAEAYRYNFLIDCKIYRKDVAILTPLIDELMEFAKT
jgi:HEPN domain-containing protein